MDGTARQGPAPSINQQVRSPHPVGAPAAVDGATARGRSTEQPFPDAARPPRQAPGVAPAGARWIVFPCRRPSPAPLGRPGSAVPSRLAGRGPAARSVQGRRKSGPGPSHFRGKNRQKPECETGCGTDRAIQFRRRSDQNAVHWRGFRAVRFSNTQIRRA